MFQSPEYSNTLSLKLSEVLEDVGVNEEMVMNRRRVNMLMASITTVTFRSTCRNATIHYLGSQSEGTTTIGLNSDVDTVIVKYDYNVMQDWSEWKQGKNNLLMIQNENVTSGYCFLQLLRSDVPLFETIIPSENYIRDGVGRILLRNTLLSGIREDAERHGPSNAVPGGEEYTDTDIVYAFPCNSWPQSASQFLESQGIGSLLSPAMKRYVADNECFVVGASSKISTYPELEWRISTSLGERCLMFSLNITQLQCYVLMKIILKTFLDPQKESALSSFMCKTAMLHCIENTERNIWENKNLFTCLTFCLLKLRGFVQNENCPHFIISENNLMAGQFTNEEKDNLLRKIGDTIQGDARCLLRITIDDLGYRLQVKLNRIPLIPHAILDSRAVNEECSSLLLLNLAKVISKSQLTILAYTIHLPHSNIERLKQVIIKLANYSIFGNRLEQFASRCLMKVLSSTLGSIIVSSSIVQNNQVPYSSLMYLSLGLDSDVTSGRLKLASVFYRVGDMDRTEFILRQTESRYNPDVVEAVCSCWSYPLKSLLSAEFKRKCCEQNENCIFDIVSFCVRFLQIEVNCVPRELQYEMMRSTRDDMQHRSLIDSQWMNYAVVDSLPYLYFLQYKTYGKLHRYQDRQRALNNLLKIIVQGGNFGHRETTLNLLGQCMEQENKYNEALQCYMLSIQQRERNNAAKFHICRLLAKCLRKVKD
ncbi:uncharacterized protein LOC132749207 [Ruditapes philippinarum]|uniref:uncharacterized protein LOC132749207 n=1 Tax=Ruditapes philippinarum TaxID=129788 RepID=UPI00295AE0F9|nr:uncharacterized protein LOC132749207 [Ruditapes philippinarum]